MSSSSPASKTSTLPVLSRLREIIDFLHTLWLVGTGFIVPEIADAITALGMGLTFDPAKDIDSLEGKVILVTGGTRVSVPDLYPHSTDTIRQCWTGQADNHIPRSPQAGTNLPRGPHRIKGLLGDI